jgi:DNA primase
MSKINLEEVKNINIQDVLNHFKIEIKNNQFKAVWRGETSASCSIKNNFFKDFGGDKKGSVIDLWQAITGSDTKTAIHSLNDLFLKGIRSTDFLSPQIVKIEAKNDHVKEQKDFTPVYTHLLKKCPLAGKAKDYVLKRKLNLKILEGLNFGYINDSKETYFDIQNSMLKHFTLQDLKEAGLFNENGKFKGYFDSIIIPYTSNNQIKTLQFRYLGNDEKTAKYRFLSNRIKPCFLLDDSIEIIKKSKIQNVKTSCIITEGVFDCISSIQYFPELEQFKGTFLTGFALSSASDTNILSENNLASIVTLSDQILLCFDNDEAGDRATKAIYSKLIQAGMEKSKILRWIPENVKDLNEFFINQTEKMRA